VHRGNIVGGQPRAVREVDFDIVTPKISNYGPDAEVVKVVDEILDEFPPFHGNRCSFLFNHADVADAIFDCCRIPKEARRDIAAVLGLPGRGSALAKARAQLIDQYRLPSSALNELAVFHMQGKHLIKCVGLLFTMYDLYLGEFDVVTGKLMSLVNDEAIRKRLDEAIQQLHLVVEQCKRLGVHRRIAFAPLITQVFKYVLIGRVADCSHILDSIIIIMYMDSCFMPLWIVKQVVLLQPAVGTYEVCILL
jgi:translation initiation factor 2-alpha kinase 4